MTMVKVCTGCQKRLEDGYPADTVLCARTKREERVAVNRDWTYKVPPGTPLQRIPDPEQIRDPGLEP